MDRREGRTWTQSRRRPSQSRRAAASSSPCRAWSDGRRRRRVRPDGDAFAAAAAVAHAGGHQRHRLRRGLRLRRVRRVDRAPADEVGAGGAPRRIAWLVVLVAGAAWVIDFVAMGAAWQNEVRRSSGSARSTFCSCSRRSQSRRSRRSSSSGSRASCAPRRAEPAGCSASRCRTGSPRRSGSSWSPWSSSSPSPPPSRLREALQRHLRQDERHDREGHRSAAERPALRQQRLARQLAVAGAAGTQFRGQGPSQENCGPSTGGRQEPIRVYVGLDSAPTAAARAARRSRSSTAPAPSRARCWSS